EFADDVAELHLLGRELEVHTVTVPASTTVGARARARADPPRFGPAPPANGRRLRRRARRCRDRGRRGAHGGARGVGRRPGRGTPAVCGPRPPAPAPVVPQDAAPLSAPAPHAGLRTCPGLALAIVSASPELFLPIEPDRHGRRIETRPIKGTAADATTLATSG